MAVVTKKSLAITNRDATPVVPVGASIFGGAIKECEGFVTTNAGDSATSVYQLVSVPSNSRITSIVLQSEALGTSCSVNCGVYAPTQSNPALVALGFQANAVINATFFASAQAVATATTTTEIINQSASNTLNLQELELWQALGLASDPGCMLDISLAVQVATVNAARIGIKVKYVL